MPRKKLTPSDWLTRAREWGPELRAREGGVESAPPYQLSSYESWNHQIFIGGRLAKYLYDVQFWLP